jgi:hypothetical protein
MPQNYMRLLLGFLESPVFPRGADRYLTSLMRRAGATPHNNFISMTQPLLAGLRCRCAAIDSGSGTDFDGFFGNASKPISDAVALTADSVGINPAAR